jgi:transposase-like protein
MAMGKVRDKRKEAFWRRTVRRQGQSGLTVRAFCREHELRETAFYFWRRELARRDATDRRRAAWLPVRRATPADQRRAAFMPVQVLQEAPAPAGGRIEIVLSGDRRVHVAAPVDRRALADVVAVLEGADRRGGVHAWEARAC